jgi:hypothetical protein
VHQGLGGFVESPGTGMLFCFSFRIGERVGVLTIF